MRLLIQKVLLLSAIAVMLGLTLSFLPGWRYHFKPGQTESNLFIMPTGQNVDLLLLGTSHGRIFSRAGNQTRVEQILQTKLLNLSTGGGRGIYAARLYLDYFFRRGNNTHTIIYFIDPWVFYSPKWNEDNDLFSKEPLDFHFLKFLIAERVNPTTLVNYVRAKLVWSWFLQAPTDDAVESGRLTAIDSAAVKNRVAGLYPDGLIEANFAHYEQELIQIATLAKSRQIRLVLIIPTTLLGDLPGKARLLQALAELRQNYGVEYYDDSSVITDPTLYADHDHLNTAGVSLFTQKYLAPLFKRQ